MGTASPLARRPSQANLSVVLALLLLTACSGQTLQEPSMAADSLSAEARWGHSWTRDHEWPGRKPKVPRLPSPTTPPSDSAPTTPGQPQRIVLTPDSVALPMNGEKQFAVQVVMSDGSTERPALQWVATGGSVGSEGFYKAGKSPGRYRVIARTFDGRLADTAKVVILDGPASPPPAPPPPPPPASGSCSDGSYVRLVTVSSASSLAAALSNAQPGDRIMLADGKYVGRFKATKQGTSARPITVCGSSNAILDGGSLDGGYGLHLDGARYWVFRGFTITNAMKGVILDQAYYNEVDGLTVHDIRDEVVHLRKHSSYNVIRNNHLYRGGRGSHHGEGIYLGSAESNWCTYTDCQPDNVTNNKVLNNLIEDMTAEGIEAKEATRNNLFDGNTIRRAGQQLSSSGSMGATASIAVRGGSSTFSNNVVEGCSTTCPVNGVQVYSGGGAGDGDNNTFTDNIVDVRSSGYGFSIHSSQVGNVVGCDNVVRNAARGSWNIGCK